MQYSSAAAHNLRAPHTADQLADRIAVLDQGRIVAEGTPAELKSHRPARARLGSVRVQCCACC
jgi:ABC-type multidrug transport system fused ATPase/permease subunit